LSVSHFSTWLGLEALFLPAILFQPAFWTF
jgi:hypothetical protein